MGEIKDNETNKDGIYDTGQSDAAKIKLDDTENENLWRKPISYITWGFALTSFTLNNLMLQYILPTIGVLLLYLGFREVRKENRWFYIAWIMTTVKLLWNTVQLILYATPVNLSMQNNIAAGTVMIAIQIALFLVYRKALQTVYQKNDIITNRDSVLSAIIWIIFISICAFTPFAHSWIILFLFIIFYIIIFRSMYEIGEYLNKASRIGEAVKVNNRIITWSYLSFCLLMVAVSCIFSNHIKLEVRKQTLTTNSETRTALITLGFPEDILADISDSDADKLKGAILVDSSNADLKFGSNPVSNTVLNKLRTDTLKASTVYIELPGNLLYVLEYFDWMKEKAYWQDGFVIWGEKNIELMNGVLLYTKNGVEYTAPIPRLKCGSVTSYSFFGADEALKITGAVSYPFGSGKQRGYLLYRVQLPKDQWIVNSFMTYLHNAHPFQFPYTRAEEKFLNGSIFFDNRTQQNLTTFELKAYRDANGAPKQ